MKSEKTQEVQTNETLNLQAFLKFFLFSVLARIKFRIQIEVHGGVTLYIDYQTPDQPMRTRIKR